MYEPHPLTEITKDRPRKWGLDLLIDSIKHRGLDKPITLYEGKILDGIQRYAACIESGNEPWITNYEGNDPIGFLLRQNVDQLNTTITARGVIADKAATIPAGGNQYNARAIVAYSVNDAAAAVGISRDTIQAVRAVLRHGNAQEIEAMLAEQAAPGPLAKAIRKRLGLAKQPRGNRANIMAVGKNRERQEHMKINAVIWGDLREALDKLTGLPNPAEVAQLMSRGQKTTEKINEKLKRGLEWLREFTHAWDAIQNDKDKPQDDDNNAGSGGGTTGTQYAEPAAEPGPRREDCSTNPGRQMEI